MLMSFSKVFQRVYEGKESLSIILCSIPNADDKSTIYKRSDLIYIILYLVEVLKRIDLVRNENVMIN